MLPPATSAYCGGVAGVSEPRSTSTLPSRRRGTRSARGAFEALAAAFLRHRRDGSVPPPCASRPDPRDVGRGERVLPGLWRLRLPLDLPGVPHCNAWALAAGDGIVLVDTGMHEPGSMAQPRAGARAHVGQQRRATCAGRLTHAHPDHCGQAPTIAERPAARCGCIPPAPDRRAATRTTLDRAIEVALPERRARGAAAALGRAPPRPGTRPGRRRSRSDRDLVPGRRGRDRRSATWQVVETPGHAPSHVCLHQPERRLLISGDHLLGRVSLYFDVGYTPDPSVSSWPRSTCRGARRAARARRPRAAVHRRRAATSRPTAGSCPAARRRPRRARRRPGDRLRGRPHGLRRAIHRGDGRAG